ncbi:antitoxin Xre/MbcA/ParS toxin-binding domain-containing protein [Halomonas sp. M4R1S46]|uniref:antitoxin Xre/MbcA/ParS toxin-binding domain-containing protein n=1 Tax=Halomonas sp. M4R1S46 TaxID=2982692 RepID=UPI0021E47BC5|nr:antitoxin Xre/MbcA/ParS toxin-binding domain-containing protein [Halomonas sp. M4R1S46]UYG06858.1 DUF2384 domain-containing protein [Halomonas sp. M4R1S46]
MTQPTHHPTDPLERIFAYRAIDLRDRFPQPLETFREALECLQSDRSYMAAMSGEIIAYLRGGYSLTVPDHFFLRRSSGIDASLVPPEENDAVCEEVEAWLRTTLAAHEKDLPEAVPLEDRPYSLDQLLQQCDLQAPELGELKEWHDAPDVGREILDGPSEIDIWKAAERLLEGREGAERWMTSPEIALRGRTPADVMVEEPQQVYDLIMRLEYGVCT